MGLFIWQFHWGSTHLTVLVQNKIVSLLNGEDTTGFYINGKARGLSEKKIADTAEIIWKWSNPLV